jgi:hypothetical protein
MIIYIQTCINVPCWARPGGQNTRRATPPLHIYVYLCKYIYAYMCIYIYIYSYMYMYIHTYI